MAASWSWVFFLLVVCSSGIVAPTTQRAGCGCIARCDCFICECVAGADCGPIQPNGPPCCLPDEVLHHASSTFKCFYQNQNKAPGSCDFAAGTDPCYRYCICTSSATATCTSSTASPPAPEIVTAPPTSDTAPTPPAAPPSPPPTPNTAPTPLAAPTTSRNGVVIAHDTSIASLHSFSFIPFSLIFLLLFSTHVI